VGNEKKDITAETQRTQRVEKEFALRA
jgi:hypothetical protein